MYMLTWKRTYNQLKLSPFTYNYLYQIIFSISYHTEFDMQNSMTWFILFAFSTGHSWTVRIGALPRGIWSSVDLVVDHPRARWSHGRRHWRSSARWMMVHHGIWQPKPMVTQEVGQRWCRVQQLHDRSAHVDMHVALLHWAPSIPTSLSSWSL